VVGEVEATLVMMIHTPATLERKVHTEYVVTIEALMTMVIGLHESLILAIAVTARFLLQRLPEDSPIQRNKCFGWRTI
jgi:hypothetical protein